MIDSVLDWWSIDWLDLAHNCSPSFYQKKEHEDYIFCVVQNVQTSFSFHLTTKHLHLLTFLSAPFPLMYY